MRSQSLADAARDYIWLYDRRHGVTLAAIAEESGVTIGAVRSGVARAEAFEMQADQTPDPFRRPPPPRLTPLFPIVAFAPASECSHHGPIRPGSTFCCMVCHASGMDAHPALQPDPSDPVRDPQPQPEAPAPQPKKETRAVRRARKFAALKESPP